MHWDWKKFYSSVYDRVVMFGPKILLGIIVLFIGLWLIGVLKRSMKRHLERKKIHPSLRIFLQNMIILSLRLLLVIFVLQLMGVQLTFFAAIIAGLSVAVGLALSGTLQNFVSGVLVLVLRPYKVGENIVVQGMEGTVQSIQLFYTVILTYDNKTIIVPNGQLSNNPTINLSREGKRRLDITMKFSYKVDFEDVKKIMLSSIESISSFHTAPAARVGISLLETETYTILINAWGPAHGFEDTRLLLNEALLKNLKAAGVPLHGLE